MLATSFALETDGRYQDSVFSNVDTSLRDIFYRRIARYNGGYDSLKMTAYQPVGDTLTIRPTVVFIHGGGFLAGAYNTDPSIRAVCVSLALRGYVAIAVGYRLGISDTGKVNGLYAVDKFHEAVYRAVQDVRAAIRYVKDSGHHARVDTNRVFIGGVSAGAATAINVAYLDQDEVPVSFVTKFGPLDGIGQYDYPGNSTNVRGVINLEGGITDTSWIESGNVPIVSFYGKDDPLLAYSGIADGPAAYSFFGGKSIHRRAGNLGILNVLEPPYTYPAGHGSSLAPNNLQNTVHRFSGAIKANL